MGAARRQSCHQTNIQGAATGLGPDVVPMRASQTIAVRCFVASLIGLCWVMVFWVLVFWVLVFWVLGFGPGASWAADDVRQPIAIQFSLDRPIDAGAAPFVMASARGLF